MGKKMYNYLLSSWESTFITIWVWISECRLIATLKSPNILISFKGWISEGLISTLSDCLITFEISVGFTDP